MEITEIQSPVCKDWETEAHKNWGMPRAPELTVAEPKSELKTPPSPNRQLCVGMMSPPGGHLYMTTASSAAAGLPRKQTLLPSISQPSAEAGTGRILLNFLASPTALSPSLPGGDRVVVKGKIGYRRQAQV